MRAMELSPRGSRLVPALPAGSSEAARSALVRRASLKSMRTLPRPALAASASTGAIAIAPRSAGSTSVSVAVGPMSQPGKRRVRRLKSYSESGAYLDRLAGGLLPPSAGPSLAPSTGAARARPYSAGDAEDLSRRARVVSISGFSKSAAGTWFFKVDVGSHALDGYAVRRRFTDFKLLHEGLQYFKAALELPELPPHGFYSVFQMFVAPDKALAARARRLQELLEAINRHPVLSRAAVFANFLGSNPSSTDGYVSLSAYEVPNANARFDAAERSSSSYSYSHPGSVRSSGF